MMYDMHMHTRFSPDSDTALSEYVLSAQQKGLTGICVTDHLDIGAPLRPEHRPSDDIWGSLDFESYFDYIDAARKKSDIDILTGLELGVAETNLDEGIKRIAPYEFDFIIASFHFYDNKDPFFPDFFEGRELHKLFEDYYASAYKCLCEDLRYSVVGHLTYLYKCPVDFNTDIEYEDYPDLFDAIMKRAIETGHGFEVNTSSLRSGTKPMPTYGMLKRYFELGGEILTLGSDSHYHGHIAYEFESVCERLKSIGFKYACYFKDMKPEFYKL